MTKLNDVNKIYDQLDTDPTFSSLDETQHMNNMEKVGSLLRHMNPGGCF